MITEMCWCGSDALCILTASEVHILGPEGSSSSLPTRGARALLVQEVDCVRVIEPGCQWLVQRVPESTVDIFGFGSVSPSAVLYDARLFLDKDDPAAEQLISSLCAGGLGGVVGIGSDFDSDLTDSDLIHDAVEGCCDAAVFEWDVVRQNQLLLAAAYGRSLCKTSWGSSLIDLSSKTCRLLNTLRQHDIGLPLTAGQLDNIGISGLLDLLLTLRLHSLAFRVAKDFNDDVGRVLTHWAKCKIDSSERKEDEEIEHILFARLCDSPGVAYHDIAAHAVSSGRKHLATVLINAEPDVRNQVPLLLDLKEFSKALDKALEGGDPNMSFAALSGAARRVPIMELVAMLKQRPAALSFFRDHMQVQEAGLVHAVLEALGDPAIFGRVEVEQAITRGLEDGAWRLESAKIVGEAGKRIGAAPQDPSEAQFVSKAFTELASLQRMQLTFETEIKKPGLLFGLGLLDTVRVCLAHGFSKQAMQVKTEFRIPEATYGMIRVQSLAETANWQALGALIGDKKQILPVAKAFRICVSSGAPIDISARFAMKIQQPEQRLEAFERLGLDSAGAAAAAEVKDLETLQRARVTLGSEGDVIVGALERILRR